MSFSKMTVFRMNELVTTIDKTLSLPDQVVKI